MLVRLRTLLQKSIKLGNNGLPLPSITSGGCQYQCPESLFSQMTYYVSKCQVGHKPCPVTYSWSHTWHSPAQQVAANFISVHVNRPFQHPRWCSVSCRLRRQQHESWLADGTHQTTARLDHGEKFGKISSSRRHRRSFFFTARLLWWREIISTARGRRSPMNRSSDDFTSFIWST